LTIASGNMVPMGEWDLGAVVGPPPQQSLRNPSHRDLDEVHQTIARLSATVTEDILRATDVLLSQDLDEAERMIVADDDLDATCVAVERRCLHLLVLQAPVASGWAPSIDLSTAVQLAMLGRGQTAAPALSWREAAETAPGRVGGLFTGLHRQTPVRSPGRSS
jgi:PhoU domain